MEYIIFAAGAVFMGLFCLWMLLDSTADARTRREHPERASITSLDHGGFGTHEH